MSRPTEIMFVASATSTAVFLVERQGQPALGLGDLVGGHAGGQLDSS